ncbi:site-specific DNA-methyltransferase [Methanolapillus millepedarum]|uniref:DNA methylase N-4/N-6 domain-containing protein n=1 Tax=Methanolapillus millepedarum TaxID=3028296 RepID=A0AA97A409_9EURY|nr:hypothetical protein MsAc7_10150 [Methanosarcinaceae archaeon Ac7]
MPEKLQKPEKLNLKSEDIASLNKQKLKQLFPSVFTETKNEKGKLVESIDFEKLKAELGEFSDIFESRRERYGMDWPGKKDCMTLIQQQSIGTLKPSPDESVNFDSTGNLYVEGDNLEVLKLLQKSYYSKVKMIYIDPPYNTGNEFIYPDNYSENLDTYLMYAGLVDNEGRKFSTNTANEGRFHTKWMNMIYPRLYLARNLLTEDGVIFVSIDDNEVDNLKKICNEIFGEENCIGAFVWRKKVGAGADSKQFFRQHESILLYAKNATELGELYQPLTDEQKKEYSNPDNDARGAWASTDLTAPAHDNDPKRIYDVTSPTGRIFTKCWSYTKENMNDLIKQNLVWFGNDGNSMPKRKRFLNDKKGLVPRSWIDFSLTSDGKKDLEKIEAESIFDYPKPVKIIKYFLTIGSDKNSTVLDFFSGSSTTAHAVMQLNAEDGGNRKFIMAQLPEPCAEDSEAFKAGYKTIADVGKERIRRAGLKIKSENQDATELDIGFKVFKLDQSNFKMWDSLDSTVPDSKILESLDLFIDNIRDGASQEDILYEILLKAGFSLTEKIEKKTMAGKTVYSVSDGALLICLDNEITRELIDEIAASPVLSKFICLDLGFKGNDQLKANAVKTFEARNQGREKGLQMEFRTI